MAGPLAVANPRTCDGRSKRAQHQRAERANRNQPRSHDRRVRRQIATAARKMPPARSRGIRRPSPPPTSWPVAADRTAETAEPGSAPGGPAAVPEVESERDVEPWLPDASLGPVCGGETFKSEPEVEPETDVDGIGEVASTTAASVVPAAPRRAIECRCAPVSPPPESPGGRGCAGPPAEGTTSRYCDTPELPGGARYVGCPCAPATVVVLNTTTSRRKDAAIRRRICVHTGVPPAG
jgi:hypothetical protein